MRSLLKEFFMFSRQEKKWSFSAAASISAWSNASFGIFETGNHSALAGSSPTITSGWADVTPRHFLGRWNESGKKRDAVEKQKMARAVVKHITVGNGVVTIHHSIPLGTACTSGTPSSYPLCTRSDQSAVGEPVSESA
jgi:hypothetical protein